MLASALDRRPRFLEQTVRTPGRNFVGSVTELKFEFRYRGHSFFDSLYRELVCQGEILPTQPTLVTARFVLLPWLYRTMWASHLGLIALIAFMIARDLRSWFPLLLIPAVTLFEALSWRRYRKLIDSTATEMISFLSALFDVSIEERTSA